MDEKLCKQCKKVKLLSEFYISGTDTWGNVRYFRTCKNCAKENGSTPEARERQKQWRLSNPDYHKNWKINNPDKVAIYRLRQGAKRIEQWESKGYILFDGQPIDTIEVLWSILCQSSCKDCHEDDPIVLEFDHLSDKDFTISQRKHQKWNVKMRNEIIKCDVVCANCHRKRTAERNNSWRVTYSNENRPFIKTDWLSFM